MKRALESVLSRASQAYGILKSTLHDHNTGNILPGVNSGNPTLLTGEEEEDLVSFLIECAQIGYPRARLEVIAMAEMVTRKERLQ